MMLKTKRPAMVLIAVLCIIFLAGCQIDKVDEIPVDPGKPNETPVETPTEGENKLKELAIHYEGKSLQISQVVNDEIIADLFGAAKDKTSHTYTAADNMDPHIGRTTNEYKFPGLSIKTINTLEKLNEFYVYKIDFSNPMYSTLRGLKVGDSLDKLKEKYPEINIEAASANEYYLYNPIDHFDAMGFTVVDNKVSGIQIYTLLE